MSTKLERDMLERYEVAEYWQERGELCRYLGGFFDGEGCVRMTETIGGGGAVIYGLDVSLAQKRYDESTALFERIRWFFNGNLHLNNKSIYQWNKRGQGAALFLRDIRPYLILKAHQVDVALDWFDNRKSRTEDESRAAYQELTLLKRYSRHEIDNGSIPLHYWGHPTSDAPIDVSEFV